MRFDVGVVRTYVADVPLNVTFNRFPKMAGP
jgi:hypothetical protein